MGRENTLTGNLMRLQLEAPASRKLGSRQSAPPRALKLKPALGRALDRARAAVSEDSADAQSALEALAESEQFGALSNATRVAALGQFLPADERDTHYLGDIFQFLAQPALVALPREVQLRLLDGLRRHARHVGAREALHQLLAHPSFLGARRETQIDLIAYLVGPSVGSFSDNTHDLDQWWSGRRAPLLAALKGLSELGPVVDRFLDVPSRKFTLGINEHFRGGVVLFFGEPSDPRELAYYLTRVPSGQMRLKASNPLDSHFSLGQTFHYVQTLLTRREELALVTWVQENYWVGIRWAPVPGEEFWAGTHRAFRRILTATKETAQILAAPRGGLRFQSGVMRNGVKIGRENRPNSDLDALMLSLTA